MSLNKAKELLKYMKRNIKYGYLSKDNRKIYDIEPEEFHTNYKLQTPQEVKRNKLGVCWDQTEFQRYVFNKYNIENEVIYIIKYQEPDYPTHTFSVFKHNNEYYYFEHAYLKHQGIKGPFKAIDPIIKLVIKYMDTDDMGYSRAGSYSNEPVSYSYAILPQPKYGIGVDEFMKFADQYLKNI